MSQIKGKFIENNAVNDEKILLRNNQPFRARNAANNADVELFRLNGSDVLNLASGTTVGGNAIATTADIPATFRIQGNWDANTNTPSLSSGVNPIDPLEYPLYIVSVAGNTNLDGFTDWQVGDKAYFANGQWYKADNNDAVASVNGQSGVVTLDSDDISEGVANLYFTDLRAQTATISQSLTSAVLDKAPSEDAVITYVANQLANVSSATPAKEVFTHTGVETNFVLTNNALEGSLDVKIAGAAALIEGTDYTWSAGTPNTVTFIGTTLSLLESGDVIEITYLY